eukprot:7781574-Pyramimonas_sp.AAC.1
MEAADKYRSRAVGQALSKARRGYQSWVLKMWKSSPGVLHRHVKGDLKVKPAELIRGNDIYATPNNMIDLRADEWSDTWSDPKADLDKVRA